jgi:hypothetical protein
VNKELYTKITGYLEGIANINSFYGICYGHEYQFVEYEYSVEINECVESFLNNSAVPSHKIVINGLERLTDWKGEIFDSCSEWFFSLLRIQNFGVMIEDENGKVIQAEKDRDSNFVINTLLQLLDEFFCGTDIIVYKLLTEPNYIDEFAWEQFFFDCGKKVYVLNFYQWG